MNFVNCRWFLSRILYDRNQLGACDVHSPPFCLFVYMYTHVEHSIINYHCSYTELPKSYETDVYKVQFK